MGLGQNKRILGLFGILIIGILIGIMWDNIGYSIAQQPLNLFSGRSAELDSPADRISEDQVKVFPDRVVINLDNASWARFTDTNSMDPFIDSGANSIEIMPDSEDDIHIGDVISFRTIFTSGIMIHRVIETGVDEAGRYFYTKGDNNPIRDPGKRRFEDIQGVVVGVIY